MEPLKLLGYAAGAALIWLLVEPDEDDDDEDDPAEAITAAS